MPLSLKAKELFRDLTREGVSRSAGALTRLSRTGWGVMSSSVDEIPAVRLLSWFSRSRDNYLSMSFEFGEALPIELVILFSEEGANILAKAPADSAAGRTAITGIAETVAQGVVGAIGEKLGRAITAKDPKERSGKKADIVAQAIERYDGRHDMIMISHVELYSENLAAECSMVLVVNEAAFGGMLEAAGAQ